MTDGSPILSHHARRVNAAVISVAVVLLLLVTAPVAGATLPRWTAAMASKLAHSKCAGVGMPVNNQYLAFRCKSASGGMVWAKIRPDGKKLCRSRKSLAAVSRACMTVSFLGSAGEAGNAVRAATAQRFHSSFSLWQSFSDLNCAGSRGVYHCDFVSAVSGTATVTWSASGPSVAFTSLTCTGAYEGRPECVLP